MRRTFAVEIHRQMQINPNIWVIVGDLGYGVWDKVREDFPDRFINVGAAEVSVMDIGIGLALMDKIPIVYSITTFLLYRAFEQIRTYINYEKIPVKLVGSGRDKDYLHDGISHWSEDDKDIMKLFPNIQGGWPTEKEDIPGIVEQMIRIKKPYYINLARKL